MSDILTLNLTDEERERIEHRAHQHGFDSVAEYILALIQADQEADDLDAIDIREEFKEAWRQVNKGETLPLDALWNDDDE